MRQFTLSIAALAIALALPACRSSVDAMESPPQAVSPVVSKTVQPGAPGDPTGPVRVTDERGRSAPGHTAADTQFMQGMIAHHGQALEMTALASTRSDAEDFGLLTRRIDESQRTEIAFMQRWLRERGESVPDATGNAHHGMGHAHDALMPGMLTQDQMNELRQSAGAEFERLFLKYMIMHHEGALAMVATLLAADGAAQDGQIYRFATDVDADQRMEIRRMGAMLGQYQDNNPGDK